MGQQDRKTRQEDCYLSKSSNTTVSGTISLKPATASSSVTTSAPKQSEIGSQEGYTRQEKKQGTTRAVPLTGDVGALPAAARAATGGLRRPKVAGLADQEVNLTT